MTFLSPFAAIYAAAVAVPLLLLLYFLKLRRRITPIASTLLWSKSFEDLQVNVPFQRLKLTLLFLLQALILLCLLAAIADPVLEGEAPAAERVVLLIDRSASMSARDMPSDQGVVTRLESAKTAAHELIDRLTGARTPSRVMIIAVGANARIVQGFDARPEVLKRAVDAIDPTDEPGDLNAAFELAGAVLAGEEADSPDPPDVLLLSDGCLAPPDDPAGFTLAAGRFRFLRVGPDPEADPANVGFAAMNARRDPNDPTVVNVFVRLVNASTEPVETLVTLSIDDAPGPMQTVRIPGRSIENNVSRPGETTALFPVELSTGAVLRVEHARADALPSDDRAAVVMPAPMRPRIAIIHPGAGDDDAERYIREPLAEMDPAMLRLTSLEAYQALLQSGESLADRFDLVVFDRVSADLPAGVPSITFGAVPKGLGAREPSSDAGRRIRSWSRRHPVMRYVALDDLVYADFGAYILPDDAEELAAGPDGPVIASLQSGGQTHILVGFALRRSNWPLEISYAVFLQNALDHLTLARSGQSSIVHLPGRPIPVRLLPGAEELVVSTDGESIRIPADSTGAAVAPAFTRVGLHRLDNAAEPYGRVAVSLLSDAESDLQPADDLRVNAQSVVAGAADRSVPKPLWPLFVAIAALLLVAEWLAYCRRIWI